MHLPASAQAIDAFIGEPDMLGRGHGSAFLRAIAERLIAECAPVIVIDPDRDNHRARRAYARAGFVGEAVVETATGPVVPMLFVTVSDSAHGSSMMASPRGFALRTGRGARSLARFIILGIDFPHRRGRAVRGHALAPTAPAAGEFAGIRLRPQPLQGVARSLVVIGHRHLRA